MKNWNAALGVLSLLILPQLDPPARVEITPPDLGTVALSRPGKPHDDYPSNVGAVNEGGGSANTNGMNNGLSPNSSGSGTANARAGDTSGLNFGGTGKDVEGTGEVNPAQER